MRILIDADACPKTAKEVLYKVSERRQVELVLVANQAIKNLHLRLSQKLKLKLKQKLKQATTMHRLKLKLKS